METCFALKSWLKIPYTKSTYLINKSSVVLVSVECPAHTHFGPMLLAFNAGLINFLFLITITFKKLPTYG